MTIAVNPGQTSHEPSHASPGDDATDGAEGGAVILGLVPSPGLCERIAADSAPNLPDLLAEHIDDRASWNVTTVTDSLTGSNVETPELLAEVHKRLRAGGWDYAICLTDLPVRRDQHIVIADVNIEQSIAWLSVPPMGVVQLRSRVRTAILQLMSQLRWGTPLVDDDHEKRRHDTDAAGTDVPDQRDRSPHQLLGKGVARQVTPTDGDMDVDVRYVAPRISGHARLLAGMVYANRPWTLFPSFKTTVATAFAAGAFVMIFPTVWELGDAYGVLRLVALMLVAMAILIGWIIIAHRLWEPRSQSESAYLTSLYNSATVLTITAGVVFAYVMVFMLIFFAGTVFIPDSLLESTLRHPASPVNYLKIAWATSSVATLAGAVGAGLEDTEAVRNATFGWRQRRRFEEFERDEQGNSS